MTHTITTWHNEPETAGMIYLGQIIDIDGREETILAERELRNGSGRVVGTEYEVSDETWDFIQESIARRESSQD